MLERTVETYLVTRVRALGGQAYKWRGAGGNPDRIICLPDGSTWFVEVKAPGGRLSPLQTVFRDQLLKLKQNHSVVWSKEDVDDFIAALSEGRR
jgi:streptogramin lyase